MIFLHVLLSLFTWGNNCQFSENLNGFNIQCQSYKATWQHINADKARAQVTLSQKLKIDLLFDRRIDGDYFISRMDVDKGLRKDAWLTDRDAFLINNLNQALRKTYFYSNEVYTFQKSLDYIADLPLYESLEKLSKSSRKPRIKAGYTMICRSIGKKRRGYYHVDGKKYSKRVWVGRESSDCYGRCGSGCGASSQYTQECLNHDICNRTTGENLGVCSDEFWAAADGYFGAPNCE